ncbi:ABC transporter permease [Elizabethkingia sp. JS20170427COW]|nr:ABC transporter permease [Elizabethkingia sp. JS20170427COW]
MKTMLSIILREWKRIFRLPVFYVVGIIVPPILFLFYGYLYQNKFAENLPVAVWNDDQSEISRKLIDMMNASKSIKITDVVHSEEEIKNLILSNKVLGAVYIPKNLEADIKNNKTSKIVVYTNASSLVASKMIYKDAAGIIIKGGLAAVLQKLTKQGMPIQQASALIQPVKLNTYTLYNPEYNYQEYLTPGLISVGIQMAFIVIAVLLLNWELKTQSLTELLSISNYSASNIIIGKLLAWLSLSWIHFAMIQWIVFPLFNLEREGTILNFFLLYNALVIACISFGMLVSALFEDVMLCADVALFFTSPAFVFSGFTFPRAAMPWYDQYYAAIMPYTYFLDGFLKGYFMQLPLEYFSKEMWILGLMSLIFISLTIFIYQFKINKFKQLTIRISFKTS